MITYLDAVLLVVQVGYLKINKTNLSFILDIVKNYIL